MFAVYTIYKEKTRQRRGERKGVVLAGLLMTSFSQVAAASAAGGTHDA